MIDDDLSLNGEYVVVYKHNFKGEVINIDIQPSAGCENDGAYISELEENELKTLLGNLIERVRYLEKKVSVQ